MCEGKLNITSDKKAYEQIMADLENLYKNKFYICENKCIHYAYCFEKAKEKGYIDGWDSDYAAKVGKNYPLQIDNKEIRIVVIGKEGLGWNDKLTPPAQLKGAYNHHYRETYKVLCEMLNYNWNVEEKKNKIEDEFKNRPDEVLTAFTLTNTYRCSFAKKYLKEQKKKQNEDTEQYAYTLYRTNSQNKHCIKILRRELEILNPTILFIQNAGLSANRIFDDKGVYPNAVLKRICEKKDKKDQWSFTFSHYVNEGNECYIIQTVHPTCYGRWYYFTENYLSKIIDYLREKNKLPSKRESTSELFKLL